jgi:anti-sigma B factor antagonist
MTAVALGDARLARLRTVCSRGARFSSEIRAVCGLFEGPGLGEGARGVAWECSRARGFFSRPPPLVAALEGAGELSRAVAFADRFQLAVEEQGSTLFLRPRGEFDLAAVGRVENALGRVFEVAATSRVVFDLRRLTFLDSSGLRTILRANERARARALELMVVRPRGTANRVFTLTRVGEELTMVDEPEVEA